MGVMDIQVGDEAPSWFMAGTTCSHYTNTVHWVCQNRRYFVLKHHGHSEWCGSFSGHQYCPTAYYLFDSESHSVQNRHKFMGLSGDKCLFRHEGRWTKAAQEKMENLCNPWA